MTRRDRSQVLSIVAMGSRLGLDYMARALSAMHRAANAKVQREIVEFIRDYRPEIMQSPEFII